MSYFIAVLLVLLLLLQIFILWKIHKTNRNVSRVHERVRLEGGAVFRQLESLLAIYWDLKPSVSLPATREWAGSPDFLLAIARHCLRAGPQVVVECSCGVSTIVLARCMQINGSGHVYSLEHDQNYAAECRRQLEVQGLSQWATVIAAPLVPTATDIESQPWYDLSGLPDLTIDALVIDGPPRVTARLARYPAGPLLIPRLGNGGKVFLDDANRPGEKEIVALWLDKYPDLAAQHIPCEKGLAVLERTVAHPSA